MFSKEGVVVATNISMPGQEEVISLKVKNVNRAKKINCSSFSLPRAIGTKQREKNVGYYSNCHLIYIHVYAFKNVFICSCTFTQKTLIRIKARK